MLWGNEPDQNQLFPLHCAANTSKGYFETCLNNVCDYVSDNTAHIRFGGATDEVYVMALDTKGLQPGITNIDCNINDLAPPNGIIKALPTTIGCMTNNQNIEWKECANDGEVCDFSAELEFVRTVIFGSGEHWVVADNGSGAIKCEAASFHGIDPSQLPPDAPSPTNTVVSKCLYSNIQL